MLWLKLTENRFCTCYWFFFSLDVSSLQCAKRETEIERERELCGISDITAVPERAAGDDVVDLMHNASPASRDCFFLFMFLIHSVIKFSLLFHFCLLQPLY